MGRWCAVSGCSNSTKVKGKTFHRFPKDESLRKLWIAFTGMKKKDPNWNPNNFAVICSDHFHPCDFNKNKKYLTLKRGSIPSSVKQGNNDTNIKPMPEILAQKSHKSHISDKRSLQCPSCLATFSLEHDLKQHEVIAHFQYECEHCFAAFSSEHELRQHATIAHEKSGMTRHVKEAHENIKEYVCKECDALFFSKSALEEHEHSFHLKIKNHICNQCGLLFADREGLEKHIKGVHQFENITAAEIFNDAMDQDEIYDSFMVNNETGRNRFLEMKCKMLKQELAKRRKNETRLRNKLFRNIKGKKKLQCYVETYKKEKEMSKKCTFLEDRYKGDKLKVMRDILRPQGKRKKKPIRPREYSHATQDFAIGVHYRSPSTYEHLRSTLCLPSKTTIRELLSNAVCLPGFQEEAFTDLKNRSSQKAYQDVTLSYDAMSLKKLASFDRKLGQCIGYVDYGGGCSDGQSDVLADEALVVMAVGLRNHWKVPLAYFNISGLKGDILAGIIKESLVKCHESGVTVRATVMDGTIHNINGYDSLGCKMQPRETDDMITYFPHPVTGSDCIEFIKVEGEIGNLKDNH